MNDDVYESISLVYAWLVDPNCTENINVLWSLGEKIITIYLVMNRNMLIFINYGVKNRYLTYRRVTSRHRHVWENESRYRVYYVEWNSVIAALLRSVEWCRLPWDTQYCESRVPEGLDKISCSTETDTAVLSACPMSRYKHSHCYVFMLMDFCFGILIAKRT